MVAYDRYSASARNRLKHSTSARITHLVKTLFCCDDNVASVPLMRGHIPQYLCKLRMTIAACSNMIARDSSFLKKCFTYASRLLVQLNSVA
jgi:hypothetical protein